MIIIHHFTDWNKRDLDNNSYKPLIDGIKKTGIIQDDSWQELSLMFLGDIITTNNPQEIIEAYVVPHDYLINFLLSEILCSNIFKNQIEGNIFVNKQGGKQKLESNYW